MDRPSLVHLTMNTGHAVSLSEGIVHQETRRLLKQIISDGGGNLPGLGAAYRVEIIAEREVYAFTIYHGIEPITLNIVCASPDESDSAWKSIERLYLELSDKSPGLIAATASPNQPSVPWIATVLLPGIGLIVPEDAGFIGHIGACLGVLLSERSIL